MNEELTFLFQMFQIVATSPFCLIPALLLVAGLFGVIRRISIMAEPEKYSPPPEFRERCPMCGCKELMWGSQYAKTVFVPGGKRGVMAMAKGERLRSNAAVCKNCGYTMTFNPLK